MSIFCNLFTAVSTGQKLASKKGRPVESAVQAVRVAVWLLRREEKLLHLTQKIQISLPFFKLFVCHHTETFAYFLPLSCLPNFSPIMTRGRASAFGQCVNRKRNSCRVSGCDPKLFINHSTCGYTRHSICLEPILYAIIQSNQEWISYLAIRILH